MLDDMPAYLHQPAAAAAATIPDAGSLTTAPLRHRLRITLDAPVAQVWALIGDLARLPEYSAGLDRVEVKKNATGTPVEYTCHFKPQEGADGIVTHAEPIPWYEPGRGWASTGSDRPDAFGVQDSLHLVTVAPAPEGSTVSWVVHYNVADPAALDAYRTSLVEALTDIAQRLTARFGGATLEQYVDSPAGPGPAKP